MTKGNKNRLTKKSYNESGLTQYEEMSSRVRHDPSYKGKTKEAREVRAKDSYVVKGKPGKTKSPLCGKDGDVVPRVVWNHISDWDGSAELRVVPAENACLLYRFWFSKEILAQRAYFKSRVRPTIDLVEQLNKSVDEHTRRCGRGDGRKFSNFNSVVDLAKFNILVLSVLSAFKVDSIDKVTGKSIELSFRHFLAPEVVLKGLRALKSNPVFVNSLHAAGIGRGFKAIRHKKPVALRTAKSTAGVRTNTDLVDTSTIGVKNLVVVGGGPGGASGRSISINEILDGFSGVDPLYPGWFESYDWASGQIRSMNFLPGSDCNFIGLRTYENSISMNQANRFTNEIGISMAHFAASQGQRTFDGALREAHYNGFSRQRIAQAMLSIFFEDALEDEFNAFYQVPPSIWEINTHQVSERPEHQYLRHVIQLPWGIYIVSRDREDSVSATDPWYMIPMLEDVLVCAALDLLLIENNDSDSGLVVYGGGGTRIAGKVKPKGNNLVNNKAKNAGTGGNSKVAKAPSTSPDVAAKAREISKKLEMTTTAKFAVLNPIHAEPNAVKQDGSKPAPKAPVWGKDASQPKLKIDAQQFPSIKEANKLVKLDLGKAIKQKIDESKAKKAPVASGDNAGGDANPKAAEKTTSAKRRDRRDKIANQDVNQGQQPEGEEEVPGWLADIWNDWLADPNPAHNYGELYESLCANSNYGNLNDDNQISREYIVGQLPKQKWIFSDFTDPGNCRPVDVMGAPFCGLTAVQVAMGMEPSAKRLLDMMPKAAKLAYKLGMINHNQFIECIINTLGRSDFLIDYCASKGYGLKISSGALVIQSPETFGRVIWLNHAPVGLGSSGYHYTVMVQDQSNTEIYNIEELPEHKQSGCSFVNFMKRCCLSLFKPCVTTKKDMELGEVFYHKDNSDKRTIPNRRDALKYQDSYRKLKPKITHTCCACMTCDG